MYINERREEILTILADREYVTVEEFSKVLGVSAVTIRTDLTSLEESGLLIRTHGGAMKSSMKGEARLISNTMIENEVENSIKSKEPFVVRYDIDRTYIYIKTSHQELKLSGKIEEMNKQ